MKFALVVGILLAFLLHAGFILFGGLLLPSAKPDKGTLAQVELLTTDAEKPKIEEQPIEKKEELEADKEKVPDAAEIIRNLEQPNVIEAPKLDAASLSAIEAALNGRGGAGDFGESVSLVGGGVIGGTGKAGSLNEKLEGAFSLAELDQKPRPTFQTAPIYPSEMRGKKVEAVVTIIFILDAAGKVTNPRVEKSSNPAFDKAAMEALKKWKFEPAVKGGERVACKMREAIRFKPS